VSRNLVIVESLNLVIVESPAKAKTIERYLGKDYRVSASMGHVRDLPPKKLGVEIEDDFRPTYTLLPGKKKALDALKKAAATAKAVYMATDLDREGEAIAWHLCEALGLDPATTRRVTFNEITKGAIQKAFAQPGTIDMNKVQAQEARRILDRLVGYKLSPLLWKKVAKGLSAGRVQSVAVRLVVEREQEIREFVPEEFWTIGAVLHRPGDARTFKAALAEVNGEKFRPGRGEVAREIGENLRRAAYRVLHISTHRIEDKAPPPFITSQLQQAAASQLGFSPKKTMLLAQGLYQGVELGPEGSVALITYMRTDSYHIAPGAIAAVRDLIGQTFGPQYLPEQPLSYQSRGRAQEAHEAIRPTDVTRTPESVRPYLESGAARLYGLIWRRFVASQMRPAQWDVTAADIEATADAVRGLFKARGRVLVYDGHTKVTGLRLGEGEQELPTLADGDPLELNDLEILQRFTQPLPRYTEATLVKKLEGLGIGRPSTYATIVSTIQDRGYVKQQPNLLLRCEKYPKCEYTLPCDVSGRPMPRSGDGKSCRSCRSSLVPKQGKRCLYATDLGEVVTGKLVQHFQKVMDYKFTGRMEDELDDVEENKIKWLQVVREFWEPFSEALKQAGEEMESAKDQQVEDAGPCPKCKAPLVKRWSKSGPFLGCSKYPDCTYTRPLEGDARPQPRPTEHKCEKCGGTMLLRYNQRGQPFLGCEKYPDCRTTLRCDKEGNPIRPEPTGEVCEKCGAPMVIRRSRRGPFVACSAYPKCRNAKPLGGKKKAAAEAPGPAEAGAERPARPTRRRSAPVMTDRDCPDCGAKLVIRSGRRGPFLGCSAYPKCKHTENLPADLAAPEGQ
jgi:DNA topoisomerase-1